MWDQDADLAGSLMEWFRAKIIKLIKIYNLTENE